MLCFAEELTAFAHFSPLAYGQEQDTDSLLAGLFAALRELDDPAIGTVFARCPTGNGKALAVQNRLLKAAGFHRIHAEKTGKVIGITGGTGCGKTTALQVLKRLGELVMDCDKIYHELLAQDASLLQAIESRFPGCVIDGKLDRKALSAIVFADSKALSDLNAITHSAVKQEVLRRLDAAPAGVPVAIDAIGLFEGGLAELCDVTVAVIAPEADRLQRIMARDGLTEQQALARIRAQKPESYFRETCDYILENTVSQEDFQEKCLAFFQKLSRI